MQLPVLSENAHGDPVRSAQTLLGGLTVDGAFGPVTTARVKAFQGSAHLAVDGIIGAHTWGSLLGAPQ